jgi:hypothetical protein
MKTPRNYVLIDVDPVQVYFSEIIEEIPDELLTKEMARRKMPLPSADEDFETVLSLLRCRNYADAELLLDRLLHPKFKNISDMMRALAEVKATCRVVIPVPEGA